jgi:hypothetical protein
LTWSKPELPADFRADLHAVEFGFGESWSVAESPTRDDLIRVIATEVHCGERPDDPEADYVFAAARQGELLISRDRGETWEVFATLTRVVAGGFPLPAI